MELQLGDIGLIIKLAIAPSFMLITLGTCLRVMTNRLSRIVDRARTLEQRMRHPDARERRALLDELATLYRRRFLINRAIVLIACCGLMICLVIAVLFVGDVLDLGLAVPVAGLFVAGMLALIGSFLYLLLEIFVATRTLSASMQKRLTTQR